MWAEGDWKSLKINIVPPECDISYSKSASKGQPKKTSN